MRQICVRGRESPSPLATNRFGHCRIDPPPGQPAELLSSFFLADDRHAGVERTVVRLTRRTRTGEESAIRAQPSRPVELCHEVATSRWLTIT